jgi:hypothetical protein
MRHRALLAAGGAAPFDPLSISGCVGWFDASDAATISDTAGAVNQWSDKSGNSWHVTRTGTNRPTTAVNTINGLNVIKFVGASNQSLEATAHQYVSATTGNVTAFAVFKPASTTGTQSIVDFDTGTGTRIAQIIRLGSATTQAVRIAGGVFTDTGGTVASGTAYVAASVQASASLEIFINGASGGATAMTGSNGTATSPLYLGRNGFAASTQVYTGDIAEVLVYNSNLSTSDRQAVQTYLNTKWAVY